jgi:hypothetical protein
MYRQTAFCVMTVAELLILPDTVGLAFLQQPGLPE